MSWATSPGWETIATWLEGISTVVAPMRAANCRSASGGSASSPAATRYQDGRVFQAGTPITSVKADAASGCCTAYITLALTGVDVAGEVVDEVVFGQPPEAAGVGEQVRQRRGHRSLGQQPAQRFTLVQAERGDVDQAGDVRGVRAEGGHDLAAVGVPGDDGGAVLQVQHLAQPGNVVGQRGQRELGCGDVIAAGLEALDDAAPARAVGPCAVDENDVRPGVHLGVPFVVVSYGHRAAQGRTREIGRASW